MMARTQMSSPKAMISHQSHAFSDEAKSVDFLKINVHLVSERPKPERAPYLKGKK